MPTLPYSRLSQYCATSLINDYIAETCFSFFQTSELARLACSHCKDQCRKYLGKCTNALWQQYVVVPRRTGHDIYGQKIDNHDANGELVECGICKKSVAASRFAPHLEKCMGLGRSTRTKRSRNDGESIAPDGMLTVIVGRSASSSDAENESGSAIEFNAEDTYRPKKRAQRGGIKAEKECRRRHHDNTPAGKYPALRDITNSAIAPNKLIEAFPTIKKRTLYQSSGVTKPALVPSKLQIVQNAINDLENDEIPDIEYAPIPPDQKDEDTDEVRMIERWKELKLSRPRTALKHAMAESVKFQEVARKGRKIYKTEFDEALAGLTIDPAIWGLIEEESFKFEDFPETINAV